MDYRQHISGLLADATDLPAADLAALVEVPKQREHGDFAFPCFVLAKTLRRPPPRIAAELAERIQPDGVISEVTALGPFLNFRVGVGALAAEVVPAILDGSFLAPRPAVAEKIMVEYSQPNTHKAMHVGHARCAALGDALVRLFEWAGHEVVAANYIGDEGTHVARCLWYLRDVYDGPVPDDNLGEFLGELYTQATERLDLGGLTRAPAPGVTAARVTAVADHPAESGWKVVALETAADARSVVCGGTGYAAGDLVAWAAPGLRVAGKEVDEREMKGVASAGMICSEAEIGLGPDTQRIAVLPDGARVGDEVAEVYATTHEFDSVLAEHARRAAAVGEVLLALENGEPEIKALWEKTKLWSMAEFHRIYEWLNCRFDTWFYESDLAEPSKALVRGFQESGVFVESEGAVGADLSEAGQGFCMLIKSNGAATYACRDLALAVRKFEDYGVDRSVYVVDSAQSLHFRQVFECLERMGCAQASQCHHHAYEQVMLKGPDGGPEKMSSRRGNVILFSELQRRLTAAIERDYLSGEDKADWSEEEKRAVARAVPLAAIRYGMLKQDGDKKILFDLDEWIDPKGNTGPYLMYPVARVNSIQRKLGKIDLGQVDYGLLGHEQEQTVLLALQAYPASVLRAAADYAPNHLCGFLYDLARKTNSMYNHEDCHVLRAENDALKHTRAALNLAVAKVLAHGLGLLGIEAADRM